MLNDSIMDRIMHGSSKNVNILLLKFSSGLFAAGRLVLRTFCTADLLYSGPSVAGP
jgi:hypothetical protein